VPASRVRAVEDGEVVEFGRHRLRALHTRGHANHHICVFDEVEGDIFTGDAFGLCYPALQRSGLCIFPSTSPTDFEPEEAIRSVQRIVATGARRAFPTHFGAVPEIRAAAEQMEAHLRNAGRTLDEAVRSGVPDGELNAWCIQRVRADFQAEMDKRGLPYGPKEQNLLRLDLDLNGAGIAHVARKRRQKSAAH
jgi:glyoxylase-like metal-dependent hydrolase (beta-lactamase superfamily II)